MSLTIELEQRRSQLTPFFNPTLLQREQTVFQLQFDGEEPPFYLEVSADSFEFVVGEHTKPTLTLFIDRHETFWQLLAGGEDGMRAFMTGRYRADGNIVLSQLLLYLFASKDPVVTYRVQD